MATCKACGGAAMWPQWIGEQMWMVPCAACGGTGEDTGYYDDKDEDE